MEADKKTSYLTLFWVFAKVGIMTFGGGYAMLPILEREVVENHHWASNEELADYFAIGQCTPGIIAVNTATFIGYKERGILGGIFATLGIAAPAILIMIALAGILTQFIENIFVQKAFAGIRVAVCVLIFNAVWKLKKSSITNILTFVLFLIITLVALFLDISPVLIVLFDIIFAVLYQVLYANRKEVHK